LTRDYTLFFQDILNAIRAIENFIEGMNFELFKEDDKTSSAVIRKLEIIGEAIKHIPDDTKNKHSEIPWREIAGMRDRLIHAYFGIDYKLVWETINVNLLVLQKEVQRIVENFKS